MKKQLILLGTLMLSFSSFAFADEERSSVDLFISPIAYFSARPNLGIRFPVTTIPGPLPLEISLGMKATYYQSGFQSDPSIGCESCSSPSWRSRGFEIGPQLFISTKDRDFGWIDSFDVRLAAYLSQSLGLPDAQNTPATLPDGSTTFVNSQDYIKGISFEGMAFANKSIGKLFFANAGTGLIFEPHHLSSNTLATGQNQLNEYQGTIAVEFNLGFSFH